MLFYMEFNIELGTIASRHKSRLYDARRSTATPGLSLTSNVQIISFSFLLGLRFGR